MLREGVLSMWKKINPCWWFGNDDEPIPPDWYRPGWFIPDHWLRRWLWLARNPAHNFFRYVVGVADRPFVYVARFPDRVFAPEPYRWQYAYARLGWMRLPFVSLVVGGFQFNLGWDYQGALGGAFRLEKWRG